MQLMETAVLEAKVLSVEATLKERLNSLEARLRIFQVFLSAVGGVLILMITGMIAILTFQSDATVAGRVSNLDSKFGEFLVGNVYADRIRANNIEIIGSDGTSHILMGVGEPQSDSNVQFSTGFVKLLDNNSNDNPACILSARSLFFRNEDSSARIGTLEARYAPRVGMLISSQFEDLGGEAYQVIGPRSRSYLELGDEAIKVTESVDYSLGKLKTEALRLEDF